MIRWLWKYIKKSRMLLLLTLICGLLSAVFTMLSPYVLGETIDAVVPGNGKPYSFPEYLGRFRILQAY